MLNSKLYNIKTIDAVSEDQESGCGKKYTVSVGLDSKHAIFTGHFPGNPILPGVCQVDMIRNVSEEILGLKLLLSRSSQVKYLNPINPLSNPLLRLNLRVNDTNENAFDISAEITSGEVVFMKMKGLFKEFKT